MMEHSLTITSVIRCYHAYTDGLHGHTNMQSSLRNLEPYSDPCAVAIKSASYHWRHLTDIHVIVELDSRN